MTKIPIDYSKALIYKIVCKDVNIFSCYVGSTTDIIKRRSQHKSACNRINGKLYNIYVYQFIRSNGGWSNWDVVLVEYYPCETKLELLKRERYWIEQLKATLNKVIPSRSQKEYRQVNKIKITKQIESFRNNNKNNIKIKVNEYQKNHKTEIDNYKKQYYQDNKDRLRKKQIKYYENNKPKELGRQQREYNCECGSKVTIGHKSRHIKTKKHLEYINKQNTLEDVQV